MSSPRILLGLLFLAAIVISCGREQPTESAPGSSVAFELSAATVFTVTTTADADPDPDPGSLRQAILDANAISGTDIIQFNIPGTGPHTIRPASELPPITESVVIDGYTQPGASPNTEPFGEGGDAVLMIELDGSAAGPSLDTDGLEITGGNSTVRGLVINRFAGSGVRIESDGNLVEGNYIGTDVTGTEALGNTGPAGVFVAGSNNRIGAATPEARNIISGNNEPSVDYNAAGIVITGSAGGNVIEGNFIGTDVTGKTKLGNNHGVNVLFVDNEVETRVGGTAPGAGNLVSGNHRHGISAFGGSVVVVEGNFVGTDLTGTAELGNGVWGVSIGGSTEARVGGIAPGAGNLISGNDDAGVVLRAVPGSVLQGNLIGTDAAGNASLGNGRWGVQIGSPDNTVGGTTAAGRNVISGNNYGVEIGGMGTDNNRVQGNFIGTDITGTAALGNQEGVFVGAGGQNNTIGGTTPGAGNVISGNIAGGVDLRGTGTRVQGNLIGTDVTGTLPLGHPQCGVCLSDQAVNNLIGGTTPGARNVISANRTGIVMVHAQTTGNVVQGNFIGTDVSGRVPLGNSDFAGVAIYGGSSNNIIGGTAPGAGNLIAFNDHSGVLVLWDPAPIGNAIRGNSIHSTALGWGAGLAIDLGADGVTPNDLGDVDVGPNGFQNFPVLTSAMIGGTSTTISGALNSSPNETFDIDFFSNDAADPSGFGEGQRFLGAASVSTDSDGNAAFSVVLAVAITADKFITATATDAAGNTSEFSAALEAPPNQPPELTVDNHLVTVDEGVEATNGGTVSDADGDVVALAASIGTVTNNGDGTWSWSFPTTDGPDESQVVTITADDGRGGSAEVRFDLVVNNVPLALFAHQPHVVAVEGGEAVNTGDLYDPGNDVVVSLTASDGGVYPEGDQWFWFFPATDGPDTRTVTIFAVDDDGCSAQTSFELRVENRPPVLTIASVGMTLDEGEEATNSGMEYEYGDDVVTMGASIGTVVYGGGDSWSWSFPTTDGPTESQTVTIYADDGDEGGRSEISFDLQVDNVAPTLDPVTAPLDPVAVGTPVAASAPFVDPGTGDTHWAEWDWGDNGVEPVDPTPNPASHSHTYDGAGLYTIGLTVWDDDGGWDQSTSQFVVVYDPSGGFVTGGGWIDSPEGAYRPDPSLAGKANFGFVAKYKKGADVPTGQTEFQFRVADLNFHSTSYDWLVVTGSNYARFKGWGTINGVGSYRFMLWAGDDDPDTFRIKIWEEDEAGNEDVTYDNGHDQAIGAGSIVIHRN